MTRRKRCGEISNSRSVSEPRSGAGLAFAHKASAIVSISATAIIRTRIDPRRKTRVEAILSKLGITPTHAINMLYAQIELRKAIPFSITLEDNSAIAPPIEHVAQVRDQLDNGDYPDLLTKKAVDA